MKARLIAISLLLVVMLVCGAILVYGQADTTIPKPDLSGQTYKVLKIVNGNTVDLIMDGKTTRVRLIGIDTEIVHPDQVEYYGKEASRFITNMLNGEEVYVDQETSNTVNKYGRSLYYLYRVPDGLFVNLEIVRQGYGHVYTTYPFKYMELFRYYEKKANECGKGLWARPTTTPTVYSGGKLTPEPN